MSECTRGMPVHNVVTYEEMSKKVDQLIIIPDIRAKTYNHSKFMITDGVLQFDQWVEHVSCTAINATYLVLCDRVKDDVTGEFKPYTTMMIIKQLSVEVWDCLSRQIDTAIRETQATIVRR